MQMIFEVVNELPVPRVAGVDEAPAVGDGVRFFDLTQAVKRFGRTEVYLRELYEAARPREDDPKAAARPADPDAAAVMRSVLMSRAEPFRRRRYADVSREHFEEFMEFCEARGLNPFCNQVYCTVEHDARTGLPRMVPIIAIEGARLLAHRTAEYDGNEPTKYEEDEFGNPFTATAAAYRRRVGEVQRAPFYATVHWRDYYPGGEQPTLWDDMPHVCLERCAEMAVLRKAFPQEFGGIYTFEEMMQARRKRTGKGRPERQQQGAGPFVVPLDEGYSFDPA